jgi:hypothetical protein
MSLSMAGSSLCVGYKYVTPEQTFSKNLVKKGGECTKFLEVSLIENIVQNVRSEVLTV